MLGPKEKLAINVARHFRDSLAGTGTLVAHQVQHQAVANGIDPLIFFRLFYLNREFWDPVLSETEQGWLFLLHALIDFDGEIPAFHRAKPVPWSDELELQAHTALLGVLRWAMDKKSGLFHQLLVRYRKVLVKAAPEALTLFENAQDMRRAGTLLTAHLMSMARHNMLMSTDSQLIEQVLSRFQAAA